MKIFIVKFVHWITIETGVSYHEIEMFSELSWQLALNEGGEFGSDLARIALSLRSSSATSTSSSSFYSAYATAAAGDAGSSRRKSSKSIRRSSGTRVKQALDKGALEEGAPLVVAVVRGAQRSGQLIQYWTQVALEVGLEEGARVLPEDHRRVVDQKMISTFI